jgi:hypothetical protein
MAFVLRHSSTLEVYATTFKNNYDLPFYGVVFWEDEQQAQDDAHDMLEQGWELISITEAKHKIMNVKLNNDPANKITFDHDGKVAKT